MYDISLLLHNRKNVNFIKKYAIGIPEHKATNYHNTAPKMWILEFLEFIKWVTKYTGHILTKKNDYS